MSKPAIFLFCPFCMICLVAANARSYQELTALQFGSDTPQTDIELSATVFTFWKTPVSWNELLDENRVRARQTRGDSIHP